MNVRNFYLVAAVVGAVLPYIFFLDFLTEYGLNLRLFAEMVFFASAPAAGFAVDLLIASCVFWVFVFMETRRGRLTNPWIFVAVNVVIGLSCALPLALYFRRPEPPAKA